MILSYRIADSGGNDPLHPTPSDPGTFARIRFGERHTRSSDPRDFTLGLPLLNREPLIEHWTIDRVEDLGWSDNMGFVAGDDLLLLHQLVEEENQDGLAETIQTLYAEMLDLMARHGYPHPLRMWNFIAAIHDSAAGQERYQAFSAGRAEAFDRAGFDTGRIPAASAIGTTAPGIFVYALAARSPGQAVENPRQLPAYCYPPRYGVRPPYFARAMRGAGSLTHSLFLSGTASVVGHASNHPDSPDRQLEETLRNLEILIDAADESSRRPDLLRVYLRAPHQIDWLEPRLRDWCGPDSRIIYLRGDICRRDLEIEIEGVLQP